jgi:hypothetical protein
VGALPRGLAEVEPLPHAEGPEQHDVAQPGLLLDLPPRRLLETLAGLDAPLREHVGGLRSLAHQGDDDRAALRPHHHAAGGLVRGGAGDPPVPRLVDPHDQATV